MMWMKKHLNWITFRKSSISAFSTSIFSLLCFSKIFLFSWFGDGIATPFFIGFDGKKSFNVVHGSKEHCEASLQEVHLQQHVSKNLFKVGGHLQLLHSGCQTISKPSTNFTSVKQIFSRQPRMFKYFCTKFFEIYSTQKLERKLSSTVTRNQVLERSVRGKSFLKFVYFFICVHHHCIMVDIALSPSHCYVV